MPTLPAFVPRVAACCVVLLLAGCATTESRVPGDPWEPANRKVHSFNSGVDRAALRPTARAYVKVTPKWMRNMVGNFFTNLEYPITIVNQVLQGKVKEAGQDTLRFTLNTTLGLGGFFDPASDANLPKHDEDFGQTLGRWGVPPGPFVMLPLLGPSHVRDLPSQVVNRFLQPFYWYSYGNERWFSLALSLVDKRARLLPLDATLQRAYDPYAFIRDAYSQRRLYQVYDGNIPAHRLPPEEPDDADEWDDQPTGEPVDEPTDPPADATEDAAGDVTEPAPPTAEPSSRPDQPGWTSISSLRPEV
jgi:phospholipid-binding lipoprotein MlaA